MLHVQVGPSPLALGLLVPTTLEAGFDVLILGRLENLGNETLGFQVETVSTAVKTADHEVCWWEHPARLADLPIEVIRRIESDESLLLTSTLRSAITDRHALITDLLSRRPRQADTIVMACENTLHPDSACARSLIENRALVSAAEDLDGWRRRRLWMVNGGYLGLAIHARARGESSVSAISKSGAGDWLEAWLASVGNAVPRLHPSVSGSPEYGVTFEACCEIQGDVARVLGGLCRAELGPFMRMIDERLSDPARQERRSPVESQPHRQVFSALHDVLLLDLSSYTDSEDVLSGRIPLSAEADSDALRAYAQTINWLRPEDQHERVAELNQVLRSTATGRQQNQHSGQFNGRRRGGD